MAALPSTGEAIQHRPASRGGGQLRGSVEGRLGGLLPILLWWSQSVVGAPEWGGEMGEMGMGEQNIGLGWGMGIGVGIQGWGGMGNGDRDGMGI